MSWDWLTFFVGALVGWVAQWLLDIGYWRKHENNAVISELTAEMERLRQENAQLRHQSEAKRESPYLLEEYRATLDACSLEIAQLSSSHAEAMSEIAKLQTQLAAAKTPSIPVIQRANSRLQVVAPGGQASTRTMTGKAESSDDLVLIDGISPKIAELLQGNGIRSYGQLASANDEQLRSILDAAGTRFRFADPESWPYQARLAAAGEWDALMSWQRNMHGSAVVNA